LKKLIKRIPQIKQICDERDEYHQLLSDIQYKMEQLNLNIRKIEDERDKNQQLLHDSQSELDRMLKVYNVMEQNLHYERNLVKQSSDKLEQVLQEYNDMEQNLHYERKLVKQTSEELGQLYQIYNKIDDAYNKLSEKYNELYGNSIKFESDIPSSEFWNNHYIEGGTSGTGSYKKVAKFKADTINNFIKEHSIKSLIELGCGDGNNLSLLEINDYTGVDVSSAIININKNYFIDDTTKRFFILMDKEPYFNRTYDLSISLDVIFHLLEDDVFEQYMQDLFTLSSKYVIIYSSNHEEFTKWKEYRHRKFMRYVTENIQDFELIKFLPNKYPLQLGRESETSASDFYFFKKAGL